MVLPLGHGIAPAAARRLSRRERWMVRGVLAAVAALVVVLVLAIASAGRTSAHGCIHVTIPGPVGAEQLDQCGAQAKATCRSVALPGSYPAPTARTVARECRRAGLAITGHH